MNDISNTMEVIEAIVYGGLLLVVLIMYTMIMAAAMNERI
jgi:hypothetical protein